MSLIRSRTPHLPFEMDVASLLATNPVVALWHGTAHTFRANSADIKLSSGTDAIGLKNDMTNAFYTSYGEIPATHNTGGYGDARIRCAPFPRSGTEWGDTGWRMRDTAIELAWARDAGISIMAWEPLGLTGNNWNTYPISYTAANLVPGIKIALQVDAATFNSLAVDATAAANAVSPYLENSAAYLNGTIAPIFCFQPSDLGTTWFTTFFDRLAVTNPSISCRFAPIYNNSDTPGWQTAYNTYETYMGAGSHAGLWSVLAPGMETGQDDKETLARADGHKWLWNVRAHQERRRTGSDCFYNETGGLKQLYTSAKYACENMVAGDMMYIATWNDYADGTSVCPSLRCQWAFLDIIAYYAYWFRNGSPPQIVRDCIYYAHRLHAWDAFPNTTYQNRDYSSDGVGGLSGNRFRNSTTATYASEDVISLLVFLKEPGDIQVIHPDGTVTNFTNQPAGVTHLSTPLSFNVAGKPRFLLRRHGDVVIDLTSAFTTRTGGATPGVAAKYWQDHGYGCGGSLRDKMRQLGYDHPYIEPVDLVKDWTKGMARYG